MADQAAPPLGASPPDTGGAPQPEEVVVRAAQFSPLEPAPAEDGQPSATIDLLLDVPLHISAELGRTRLPVRDVLALQQGSVVELDRLAGDPVDVLVNDRLVARGEVVVIEDKFGVRITEIIPPSKRQIVKD